VYARIHSERRTVSRKLLKNSARGPAIFSKRTWRAGNIAITLKYESERARSEPIVFSAQKGRMLQIYVYHFEERKKKMGSLYSEQRGTMIANEEAKI
jgi:hypothetical protein